MQDAERFRWNHVPDTLPEDGQEVEVVTESGDQRRLVYERRLWWLPDRSMYVYFTPILWRAL